MNSSSNKMLQIPSKIKGSNSKMQQIPLKRQLPAPKCCKQQAKWAEKQIQKTSKTEKQIIPKQFWTQKHIVTQIFESLRDEYRPHPMNRKLRRARISWLQRAPPKLEPIGRAEVGPAAPDPQVEAMLCTCRPKSGPTWRSLELFWRQLCTKLGLTET